MNESGWPDGIVFFEGIATPAFMYAGLDAAIRLAEECTRPAKTVPKAIMATVITSFVTAFPFAIAMLYCLDDFDAVLSTKTRSVEQKKIQYSTLAKIAQITYH